MILKSILEIKKEVVNIITFLQLLNRYVGYTIIILCIILITAAIHLGLTTLAIYICGNFFPKETWILIKIWDKLDKICNKILKIILHLVCLSMFIWLLINILSFIIRIDFFLESLYDFIISVLIYLTLSVILVFVSIVLIKIFDSQFSKLNLNTRYIMHHLLLLLSILIRLILIFTLILLFLFLLLHSVIIIDYCNKIITRYL